ncbi:AbrB family transcriptional regulator [Mesobacterium sp. TK19101]|uniref:AbrB family transcriptional regulator n=1 Tax=Mesobacterium hydrothermale TaxID=3111907 RepID=A0ABU6HI57_9RHOB|nr:AbrB family transcriptional regulator [Mesobacterium sp. TK19101]MEC3862139.1 AbrB family transcriptional regulator [Mesobacterium sp. TK19101]
MTPKRLLLTVAILALSSLSGLIAQYLHLPMPFMLGSLLSTGLVISLGKNGPFRSYTFPMPLRTGFVTLIGVMIGTQVNAALLQQLAGLPLMLLALALFVLFAHAGNVFIFHKIGRLDRPTAFYAGTPGGLMESIVMGEAAGADVRVVTLQQFLRIVIVITLVPTGLSLWLGTPVGSAAGLAPSASAGHQFSVVSLVFICLAGGAGLALGKLIHLPAAQLIGPLLVSAAVSLTGWVDLHLPFWLIAMAQVVIGTGLGMRFRGVTGTMLRRSAGLATASVSYMLLLGSALAFGLEALIDIPFLHLLISLSPGGVTEMSLIALSLAANPALVSLNHVLRILMTVLEMGVAARFFGLAPAKVPNTAKG